MNSDKLYFWLGIIGSMLLFSPLIIVSIYFGHKIDKETGNSRYFIVSLTLTALLMIGYILKLILLSIKLYS